ncbi:MAG: ATP-binding protein, partial [Muribaculaceae bacterium]|nr:ATP-binding protein [Muribaculaceae bacterium]
MEIRETRYPIGVQSFESLRQEGYIYVDKTSFISKLLKNKYYFLSRPRRFGKSLLLSTLEAYFLGKKELFKGLEVSEYEEDWVEHPVVHVDFSSMRVDTPDILTNHILHRLYNIADDYEIGLSERWTDLDMVFGDLITQLHKKTGRKVVILIDEYDKGIIEVLHDEKLMEEATKVLRPFFSVLKSHDRHIRFAFITGVSRFRNTTIFSGFNNPKDISMNPEFAAVCGITREELEANFPEGIDRIAGRYGYPRDKAVEMILQKYDGYRFTEDEEYVCNPFSVLNAMDDSKLDNYWVMSGSSKILVDYMRQSDVNIEAMTSEWISAEMLGCTYSTENPVSLFFQTGYLTISDWDGDNSYRLRIPNQEVQSALSLLFVPEYTGRSSSAIDNDLSRLRTAINQGDTDGMMRILQATVSAVPYHEIVGQPLEKHLHLCMHVIFMMLGANTRCEVATSGGRIDMVDQTPWRMYVFEFKLDTPSEEALRQIDDKGYALQWEARGREVTKIGVNFSTKLRTIESWAVDSGNST